MNKAELIALIATKMSATQKEAGIALDAVLGTIQDALVSQDEVRLIGFGTFRVKQVGKKRVRNPQGSNIIEVPPTFRLRFKVGTKLSDVIAKSRKAE